MAVLEGLKGIEVTVHVDGQALHEYEDDEAERQPGAIGEYQASKTVTKYVEAVTGKEFAISIKVRAPYEMDCPTLAFWIMVDGSEVSRRVLRKQKYCNNNGEDVIFGVKNQNDSMTQRCSIRYFLFAEIQTTEDQAKLQSVQSDATRIVETGEIFVRLIRKTESVKRERTHNYSLDSSLDGAFHEKALKGQPKSHGTSLGAEQPVKEDNNYRSRFLNGKDKPIGIYRFKYRSREALKSLLIIKRTPEPEEEEQQESPSPAIGLEDGLTPEMKRKMEEYKKSLLEAANDSKKKFDNIKSEPSTRVKRENPEQGQGRKINKKPKYTTTIDLTEDDEEVDENPISLDD